MKVRKSVDGKGRVYATVQIPQDKMIQSGIKIGDEVTFDNNPTSAFSLIITRIEGDGK